MNDLSRRALLSAVGSGASVSVVLKALAAQGADGGSRDVPLLSLGTADGGSVKLNVPVSTLAEAEKLLLVQYSAAERTQLARSLGDQVELVRSLRTWSPTFAQAPALRFDPRLPQTKLPARDVFKPARADAPLPASDEDLAFAPVAQLSAWLKAKKLTSERLTRLYLDRLKRHDKTLLCVATLTEELALAQAKQADAELAKGKWRGPLHGIPYGAKDLLDTAGIKTAFGAGAYKDRIAERDATVISRLREAGAVLVAKLTLGELAYNDLWYGGRTRNPWYPEEGSSGSSAGPASAVAAGLVGFAIGSETLGSIISPSMRCGVTGLRPTFGRVPRGGAMPLCWSLDKLGPMGRTVEDTALVLKAIHGADPEDAASVTVPLEYDASRGVRGLTVGYAKEWFAGEGANDVDRAALAALEKTGVKLVEVTLPKLPLGGMMVTLLAECASAFEELTFSGRDDLLVWQDDEAWPNTFRAARFISAVDLLRADRLRREAMVQYHALFSKVDALFSPSFGAGLLLATNYTGHPSLTLRAGFFEIDGPRGNDELGKPASGKGPRRRVPHGVTLWGRLYDEGTLCRLGVALEQALGVWSQRPQLG